MIWMFAAWAQTQPSFEAGLRVERNHLRVLGVWAGANLVGGSIGALVSKRPLSKSFHGTNAAWNTVNLGIALLGESGRVRRRNVGFVGPQEVNRQHTGLQRALAVNLALDGAYMTTGLVLTVRGREFKGVDLRGVGLSLLLQGAFLAIFDTHFLVRHRRVTRLRP